MDIQLNRHNVIFKYNNIEVNLDKRYFVYSENRWDFVLQALERYFINNGKKGILLNASLIKDCSGLNKKLHYTELENIWIADLKKIPLFSNIEFKENNILDEVKDIMRSPTIKWYDGTDKI